MQSSGFHINAAHSGRSVCPPFGLGVAMENCIRFYISCRSSLSLLLWVTISDKPGVITVPICSLFLLCCVEWPLSLLHFPLSSFFFFLLLPLKNINNCLNTKSKCGNCRGTLDSTTVKHELQANVREYAPPTFVCCKWETCKFESVGELCQMGVGETYQYWVFEDRIGLDQNEES